MDYIDSIGSYIELEREILSKMDKKAISDAVNLLEETRLKGGTIYSLGNGGSASTASHFACDFNKGLSEFLDIKYRFICLSDNLATFTALANDNGYENVFVTQIDGRLREGDVLLAISGSGNSENVIRAVKFAKEKNCKIIGLTGYSGGKLKELSDVSLHVPVMSMQVAEDVHMMLDHLMYSVILERVCGKNHLS